MIKPININQKLNNVGVETPTYKNPTVEMPEKAGRAFLPDNNNNAVQMPTKERNYCVFNKERVDYFVSQKEQALPYIKNVLQTSQDENEIVEALYITDRLIDKGTKGIPAMYPLFAKFNNTTSPNIQAYLSGIYRKTQVPDAFGPLVKMLIQNSMNPSPCPLPLTHFAAPTGSHASLLSGSLCQGARVKPTQPLNIQNFDPNEEIGGAILAYIENYSHNPKKIDYTA